MRYLITQTIVILIIKGRIMHYNIQYKYKYENENIKQLGLFRKTTIFTLA